MNAEAGHHYRATVAVVARISDVLQARRRVDSPPDMGCVVRLQNVFTPVIQTSVAEKKAETAGGKVDLVIFANRICDKRNPGAVVRAIPHGALRAQSTRESLVNFCVGKGLGFAIVPSKAA